MARPVSWARIRTWLTGWRADAAAIARYQALMDDVHGKSIAIVGNAQSLLRSAQGSQIDSHDLVVRMNKGFPADPAAQGQRFDVWCFSTIRMARQAPSGLAPRHAVWMSPKFRDECDGSLACCFYPLEHWAALRARLGARPSVGAMTIDLVSRAAPRAVSIFGFDFKRTATFYDQSRAAGPHDYQAEAHFAAECAQRPGWRFVAHDAIQPDRIVL